MVRLGLTLSDRAEEKLERRKYEERRRRMERADFRDSTELHLSSILGPDTY